MRIGILTSGGDCAGLNAVIRAVVNRAARKYRWQVMGINHGTDGLICRPVRAVPLDFAARYSTIKRIPGLTRICWP